VNGQAGRVDIDRYSRSRRALHGLAEGLLAGPQYATSGTIRLRVVDGAIATVAAPDARYLDGALVVDGRRVPVGGTFGDLGTMVGLAWSVPTHYSDHSGLSADDAANVDVGDAATIIEWFARGQAAMTALWPDETPVLWPEHFDLGVSLDEVNYGVSPGDAAHPEPYAYVGPWGFSPSAADDAFWNAQFGALVPATALSDAEAVATFFTQGRDLAPHS